MDPKRNVGNIGGVVRVSEFSGRSPLVWVAGLNPPRLHSRGGQAGGGASALAVYLVVVGIGSDRGRGRWLTRSQGLPRAGLALALGARPGVPHGRRRVSFSTRGGPHW